MAWINLRDKKPNKNLMLNIRKDIPETGLGYWDNHDMVFTESAMSEDAWYWEYVLDEGGSEIPYKP